MRHAGQRQATAGATGRRGWVEIVAAETASCPSKYGKLINFTVRRCPPPSWHDHCEVWDVTNRGDTMMVRKLVTALFMSASVLTVPAMMGCDREVSKTETVKTGPGGTTVKEDTVKQKADGTVERTTEMKKTN